MKRIGGKELDAFRHGLFVNDVQVLFMPKEEKDFNHREVVWVRLKEQIESCVFKGELLNDFLVPGMFNGLEKGELVLMLLSDGVLIGLPLHEQDNSLFSFKKK